MKRHIKDLSHRELLKLYTDIVKRNHYDPTEWDTVHEFTQHEYHEELLRRLNDPH